MCEFSSLQLYFETFSAFQLRKTLLRLLKGAAQRSVGHPAIAPRSLFRQDVLDIMMPSCDRNKAPPQDAAVMSRWLLVSAAGDKICCRRLMAVLLLPPLWKLWITAETITVLRSHLCTVHPLFPPARLSSPAQGPLTQAHSLKAALLDVHTFQSLFSHIKKVWLCRNTSNTKQGCSTVASRRAQP